jgi:hypothetical protein
MKGLSEVAADNGITLRFNFGFVNQATNPEEHNAWLNKFTLLERFNGTPFLDFHSLNSPLPLLEFKKCTLVQSI